MYHWKIDFRRKRSICLNSVSEEHYFTPGDCSLIKIDIFIGHLSSTYSGFEMDKDKIAKM